MRMLALVYAGILVSLVGVFIFTLVLWHGPNEAKAAPDSCLDAIQGDWVLVAAYGGKNANYVTPLDGFPSEAACRAKIARLHDSAKTHGIPPPNDYDCWPRERVRQVRQASR